MAHKINDGVVAICFVAFLVVGHQQSAIAQSGDFSDVQRATRSGDSLVITMLDDKSVKGRLVSADASAIMLLLDGQRTTVQQDSVQIVARMDSLSNGARNGFWVGLAASGIPVCGIGYVCQKESGIADCLPAMLGVAVGLGGIGAAVGAFLDAARLEVLYRVPHAGKTTSLRPVIFMRRGGWAAGLTYSYSSRP